MDCKFFTQPIPDIELSPPFCAQNESFLKEPRSVDKRIHQFLKSFESTNHLKQLIFLLNEREEKMYTPLVYTEQIIALHNATRNIDSHVEKEHLRPDDMEQAYARIAEVVKDIAYFAPRFGQNKHNDDAGSLNELIRTTENIIKMNNTLVMKFETFDDYPAKLETRKLKGLLYRTNYFWEYKNWHIHKKLIEIKKAPTLIAEPYIKQ